MEQSTPSMEAVLSQLTVRPEILPTEPSIPDQTPSAGHNEYLVVPVIREDCDSGTPPARSSSDSLLILRESAGAPSVQTAPSMGPRQLCYRLSTQNPWFLETLNAVLLLVAISAIVATLYIHAGQPLPRWPFDITINAMLSICAVALKASMVFIQTSCIGQLQWSWFSTSSRSLHDLVLFHDAGQGPLGSFYWLWTYRLRQPIAALGAFIIIVAMAVDPFVQQLIQPLDCMEELPGAPAASVPTTNVITYGDMPEALEPSIVAGFYTSQNLTDFECITGNCTFTEDYTTIGFCSSCEDVSAKVTITTNCTDTSIKNPTPQHVPCDDDAFTSLIWNITTAYPPFNLNFYHDWMSASGLGWRDTSAVAWTDPSACNGWVDQNVPYWDDTPEVFTMQSSPRWVPDLLGGNDPDSHGEVQFGVDLGVIYGMSEKSINRLEPSSARQKLTGCSDASSSNTWYCRGYGAATCLIQPCLRTYSAEVQAGRLTETLVDHTDPAADWGYSQVDGGVVDGIKTTKRYFGLVDKNCISNDQHQQLAAAGYDSVGDGQTRWLPYKVTYDPTRLNATAYNATLSSSLLTSRCLFLVDELFVYGIWEQALNGFLLGTVKRYNTAKDHWDKQGVGRLSFIGPDPVRYMWSSGRVNMTGINESMANLAQALTLWVRSTGGRDGGQDGLYIGRATGQVLHYATCAQVAWAWIALPAGLTALTLLVLAATVVATARDQLPVWKSSPLTLLFHGPGGRYWVDEGLVAAENVRKSNGEDMGAKRGMEKFSARVSVKLGDNGGRGELRLRQVSAVSQKII